MKSFSYCAVQTGYLPLNVDNGVDLLSVSAMNHGQEQAPFVRKGSLEALLQGGQEEQAPRDREHPVL